MVPSASARFQPLELGFVETLLFLYLLFAFTIVLAAYKTWLCLTLEEAVSLMVLLPVGSLVNRDSCPLKWPVVQ